MTDKKDHWSSEAYTSSASFVPHLTTKLLTLLSPQPGQTIIDLGCGDAVLTSQLSAAVGPTGRILALDSSPSMIATAQSRHPSSSTVYRIQDCADLRSDAEAMGGGWDVVFSNAALHWILRAPATRTRVFEDCFRSLKKGGRLVFEMGGKGNVAEVQTAVVAAMVAHGVELGSARESVPWFFPSAEWMRKVLGQVGFEVDVCEIEYRPTKLNPDNAEGTGGLVGWVKLMCAACLEVVEESKRDVVVKLAADLLEDIVTREEDGSQWIGYVRLRAVARKP